MGDYKREWTAICPRCDNKMTHADVVCKNCGKGKIKVSAYTTSYGARKVYFGCDRCDAAFGSLKCNKCDAEVTDKFVKTAGCFIATAVFGYESGVTRALRHFRDTVLIRHPWGREFVFWYYEKSKTLLRMMGRDVD